MRCCKLCGVWESEHHEPDWIEVPDGCVCDPLEWNINLKAVPPVCAEYVGDGRTNCLRCEHDRECHVKKEGK